ncbi:disease resistance protein RGA2-like [Mangifera indica]|uniref:disease resistance protein RGA2-like n=1 Tax=Mangifera indica TaxID=29780 RepID=UPI001CF9F90C|nr:disease resistance protein RGA2-like [Mangifera indica]
MAEALVSTILKQLALLTTQELKLLCCVDKEVEKLISIFQAIQAMIEDAENRQVKELAGQDWLDKLKEVSYDIDDVLDKWITTRRKFQTKKVENASKLWKKVCSCILFDCFCCKKISLRHDIAFSIKNLNETLGVIAKEKDRFSFSLTISSTSQLEHQITNFLIDLSEVFGRNNSKNDLMKLLLTESSEAPILSVVSIVGMGGIGKTTLARIVFNDDKVNTYFDKKIWVCVSVPFDESKIAKAILESLIGVAPNLSELETMLQKIRESLREKKFLLVLDNVWTETPNSWEQLKDSLKYGSHGSRIIVTTRKKSTVEIMGTTNMIQLGELVDDESWLLFTRIAFFGKAKEECENFIDIGRKIVAKCKGMPLALKTLGSLLRLKTHVEQWQRVLDSNLWEKEVIEAKLSPPILLSYYDLPSKLKKCISYCALFPKDYVIEKGALIKLWMAQGYLGNEKMELDGENYFNTLVMRSFFQDFQKSEYDDNIIQCKMHDIVYDCIQSIAKNKCSYIEFESPTMPQFEMSMRSIRHATIKLPSIPPYILNLKLRSLVVETEFDDFTLNTSLSKKLTCLRTLALNLGCRKANLEGIKNLIHLRYFELHSFDTIILSEALCDLYNLQTLDLTDCLNLKKLPQGIGKLVNLRHLLIVGTLDLEYIPKGVERLSCLRTLNKFIIGGDGYNNKACTSLDSLKNLKLNQRSLQLVLRYVRDINAIKLANLGSMKNLLDLVLRFDMLGDKRTSELILGVLKLPSNLLKLQILGYGGRSMPFDWKVSLSKLRELQLCVFSACEYLPPLGKLPSLESLTIYSMHEVVRVGNEFLGIENGVTSIIAFPKLKFLRFLELAKWKEWHFETSEYTDEDSTIFETSEYTVEDITIMPCLRFLSMMFCPELKAIPDQILRTPTLQHLEISYCNILRESYETEDGRSKISHIPKTTFRNIFPGYYKRKLQERRWKEQNLSHRKDNNLLKALKLKRLKNIL